MIDAPPLHERTFSRTLPHKGGRCQAAIGMGFAHHLFVTHLHCYIIPEIRQYPKVVGRPGVKPGFAASEATVLFSYTTRPSGTRAGNPTRISSLGPKRHHALDHASRTKSGRDAEN